MTGVVVEIGTFRLVPTRYPSVGILDMVTSLEDLDAIIELESWTNDRISNEIGVLHRLPRQEWVIGKPMSSVIMAAFCHPRAGGGRFNGPDRGAWYACRTLSTAHAEVIFHRTQELAEIGVFNTFVQVRAYRANFKAIFEDIRERRPESEPLYDPHSYEASQAFGRKLLEAGSNGILYRSVRDPSGECIACFRPKLVRQVRESGNFEYRWEGARTPLVRNLS
ncbi:MAG: RES family NAD+ phosphorylase [Bryobacteraceae bacterium]